MDKKLIDAEIAKTRLRELCAFWGMAYDENDKSGESFSGAIANFIDGLPTVDVQTVFCNPPYGRQIKDWVKKAYCESIKPNTVVVMLIPSRTDTAYFHDYILPYAKIRFVRGRLKFWKSKNAAPFPSMVVVFRGKDGE